VLKAAPPDGVPVMRYEHDILRSELKVMELLRSRTKIPMPTVLAVDFSRSLLHLEFYLMECVDGDFLNSVQDQLPPAELAQIRRHMGKTLREINAIPGETFGSIADPSGSSWRESFVNMMEDIVLDGEASPVELDYDAIRRVVESHASSLDEAREPWLVHWDLWEGNVAVKDGRISSVIDFERSFWGDPLMETNWMGPTSEFIEGYGTDLRQQPAARERRLLYDLHLYTIMQIEGWYRRFTDLRGVQYAQGKFAETMAALG
jgi:aminoglycoside phosphotransferase (APT) family kinase protein